MTMNSHELNAHNQTHQCWLALMVNSTGMISTIAFVIMGITHWKAFAAGSTLYSSLFIPCAWIMLITAIWHYPTYAG